MKITINKYLLFFSIIFLTQSGLIAQNDINRLEIIEQTNTKVLNELSKKANTHYITALRKAIAQGVETEILNSKNKIGYLSGFDSEGKPVYDFDDNVNSAITSRVDKIWDGGASGLNLDGSGIEIGHWEAGGLALLTHQELAGKVTHAENEAVSSHATHTAGTMIATGINSSARGMASSSTIVSRRSNNDEAEIANFAAAGGILSNHSYSSGNPNGNIPEYGAYSNNSRQWDEILYNAPFLTLCKSAGNTRNDGVNTGDNGYDLVYTTAVTKNVLTIGAVNDVGNYIGPSSVTQSSFSSWGPTDDWRIKPDLVANGVSVFSSDNDDDTDYSYKSGTSMSTPSITGAIALLQQHHNNVNSVYMKAATVKALLLGTTDEAGADDGPDFQNGWGLINAERAAQVISNNGTTSRINELSLTNGNTYTTTFETDGTSPLALAIVWTDPNGIPVGGLDNQSLMLVNDLDVRITRNSDIYAPWVLTPNSSLDNFDDPATKGDNFRDNVERIDVSSLPEGIYTVNVSHKNNLVNGFQDFSMVINGISESTSSLENLNDQDNSLIVFPNPSENGYFNISIPEEHNADNYNVQVFDLIGKLRKSKNYNNKEIKMDVSNLNSGLYIMLVRVGLVTYKQLVVVEN